MTRQLLNGGLTARKRRPSRESISCAIHSISPVIVKYELLNVEEGYSQTSVPGLWYEIDDQTKTDHIPFFMMLDLRVH
jgi:hypothetical protein